MPKTRQPYPFEFRQKIVDLVRSGRSVKEPPRSSSLRSRAQTDADAGKRKDLLTSAEREELVKLRRENKQLKTEREILAKATAWFAREADTKPKKSSGS
jgi:transposase